MPPAQARPRAEAAVERALALGPELPEAHRARGTCTFQFDRHWRTAREAFLTAVALDPHDSLAAATYGMFLATEYRDDEARGWFERALARDPHSAQVHFRWPPAPA